SKATHLAQPVDVRFTEKMAEGAALVDMEVRAHVFDVRYELQFTTELTRRIQTALRERGLLPDGDETEGVDHRIHSTLADTIVDLGREFADTSGTRPRAS
ncbi:MAG: hypothetical protein ACREQJ_13945, partial [Candidatus Binatia bacterium]